MSICHISDTKLDIKIVVTILEVAWYKGEDALNYFRHLKVLKA